MEEAAFNGSDEEGSSLCLAGDLCGLAPGRGSVRGLQSPPCRAEWVLFPGMGIQVLQQLLMFL